MDEKIQKLLAGYGIASRREIERWISAGRISVNGAIATLGMRVSTHDQISIDGKPVRHPAQSERLRVLLYNKPADEICTRHDPEGRPTVFERLPRIKRGRWIMVGRLDINSSGLLLFTTHGELAHRLMHPSYEIDREYAVRVLGEVSEDSLTRLRTGVELEDGVARFSEISDAGGQGANHWYHVTLKEGRNREVRRMWEAVGHNVSRLHRIRFGPVKLPRSIRPGRFDDLDEPGLGELLGVVGLEPAEQPQPIRQKRTPKTRRRAKPARPKGRRDAP